MKFLEIPANGSRVISTRLRAVLHKNLANASKNTFRDGIDPHRKQKWYGKPQLNGDRQAKLF